MFLVNSVFVQTQTNPPCYHTLQIRPRLRAGFRSHVTSPGQIHSLRARDLKLGNILLSSPCGTRTYPDHNLLQMKKKHTQQKKNKHVTFASSYLFLDGFWANDGICYFTLLSTGPDHCRNSQTRSRMALYRDEHAVHAAGGQITWQIIKKPSFFKKKDYVCTPGVRI